MKLANTLFAGAALVAMIPALASAQQSEKPPVIINDQINLYDLVSDVRVTVRAPSEINAYSIASGNSSTATLENRDSVVNLNQSNRGNVRAYSTVRTSAYTSKPLKSLAVAAANNAAAVVTGGSLKSVVNQYSGEKNGVGAGSKLYAHESKDIKSTAIASGNVYELEATGSRATVNLTQTNHSAVRASALIVGNRNTHNADALALAAGNSASFSGEQTPMNSYVTQTNNGYVSARSFVKLRGANNIKSLASASGNSIVQTNSFNKSKLVGAQINKNAVYAYAGAALGAWSGTANLASEAYGNSALTSNKGADIQINLTQVNSAPITARTEFSGVRGGVVNASSLAVGNSFSAFTCPVCKSGYSPSISGALTQINSGRVRAFTNVNAASAGKITASAIAIGNNASFIVQRRK